MISETTAGLILFGFVFGIVGLAVWIAVSSGPRAQPPMACPAADYDKKCDIDPEDATVKRWGARSWGKYEMWVTCDRCGERFYRFGVDRHELTEAGIDVDEQLEKRIL